MHYTSAAWEDPSWTLEEAQERKARILYDFAELDETKTVARHRLWLGLRHRLHDPLRHQGSPRHHAVHRAAQVLPRPRAPRGQGQVLPRQDYAEFEPPPKYDGLVSIEMIDHLCSPGAGPQGPRGAAVPRLLQQAGRVGRARGACFGFQAILRNRIPRGAARTSRTSPSPPTSSSPAASTRASRSWWSRSRPHWELERLIMRRTSYRKTTGEWYRRLQDARGHDPRANWGDQVYDDYDRYLSTCVRASTTTGRATCR